MKKLMTVIAAVAMSFGLFADATPFSISFETEEGSTKGVDTSLMKFTPVTGWTWTGTGDTLDMVAYDGDGYTGYGAEGSATARRSSFFDDANNVNYLKLETGSGELAREMGTDNIFVDQLVKFTGFEEPQTNVVDGTKIAVWMSGIEGDNTVEPVVEGETNLYVTCAKVDADNNVEQIALKIAGAFETEKWYRLTIKSLGNIFETTGSRAGFIVYIDGVQVASSDEAAKTLIANDNELTAEAKGYMDKGQLFPAIDATDATFNTVAYKGIGWIDDVVLDDQGPDFCQFVNVTVTEIPGAVIAVTQDGEPIEIGEDGKYAVAPGEFTVTYTADKGYILTTVVKRHNTAELGDDKKVDDSEEVKPQEVIVEVSYAGAQAEKYADEQVALAAVDAYTKDLENRGKQVVITFVQAVSKTDYAFDAGTIITITDNSEEVGDDQITSTWTISNGNVAFTAGLGNYKAVVLSGEITLTFAGAIGEGSSILADTIVAEDESIELDPLSIGITTKSDLDDAFVEVPGYGLMIDEVEEDTFTYFLAPVKAYYADLYVDGDKQALQVWLGEEGEEFFVGEEVEAEKSGVIDATVEPDFAGDKTYYVSKLVRIDDEGNKTECAFKYDGTTLTKDGEDPIGVTISEGNILSYTVVTGEANPFGEVWLKEYTPVTTFTVTATPAEKGEYTTQYKIDDGELADYTEAVTVDLDKTVTIVYTAATGYTITAGDTVEVTKNTEVKDVPAPTFAAIEYTITYNDAEFITGFEPMRSYTFETPTFKLPGEDNVEGRSGGEFKGWTNELGLTKSEVTQGTTGNLAFYAVWEKAGTDEVKEVIDDKVDGYDQLNDAQKTAARNNAAALYEACGDKDKTEAWITAVYGAGAKITAETLATAPPASVALAVAFDVPVMVNPTISAPVVATATTEGAPAAFEFAIKDGATEVEIQTLTDNVKKIVKYAAALGGTNTFGPAGDKVTIGLNEGKIKAEFVAGPAAGFMKADFTAAE